MKYMASTWLIIQADHFIETTHKWFLLQLQEETNVHLHNLEREEILRSHSRGSVPPLAGTTQEYINIPPLSRSGFHFEEYSYIGTRAK